MPYSDAILAALSQDKRSARDISIAAVGHESAIRSIKRGLDVRASTIQALCDELDLEFYIGPPRGEPVQQEMSPPPWEELRFGLQDDMAAVLRDLAPADELLVSLREAQENLAALLRELSLEDQASGEQAVKSPDDPALIDASGLFHFKGESEEEVSDLVHYIGAVRELKAAAGGGAMVLDETVTARIPFRRDWLRRHSLQADLCNIIHVAGESMEPTLPDGCSILVDRSRKRRLARHIYVLITDDGLVVKRLDKDEADDWQLVSDHPAWKPAPWLRGTEIIGQVRWMAKTL